MVATEIEKSSSRTVRRVISITSSSSRASQPAAQQPGGVGVVFLAQQSVQRGGVAGEMVGQRRGGPQHRSHPIEQTRIALEQRQKLDAGRLAGQERIEAVEHRIRLRLMRQRGEHARQQLGQQLACPRRTHGAHVTRLPAAHRRDDARGIFETQRAQRRGSRRGRRIHAGKIQFEPRLGRRQQLRYQFEHLGIARPHLAQVVQQFLGKLPCVGVAHEDGEARQFLRPVRQLVRLSIGGHLQPVFDTAQETICGSQFARGSARHVARPHQRAQRAQCCGHPQHGIATTPDKLQGLRQEFDLPDAAFAQLHVVAGNACQRIADVVQCAALVLVDAPLHRVNIGDRGEIQATAPDKGADRLEETGAEGQIAGNRTRLDHRGALPVLAHALVVGDRRRQRDGGGRHRGIGAQAQIGAKYVAVGVARLHQRHKPAGDARHDGAHRMAIAGFRVY
jgi:hypothetical protein